MIHSSSLATRPFAVPHVRSGMEIPIQARVELARQRSKDPCTADALLELMAERLVEHECERGAGTEHDLARDGFTAAEILEHGPDAIRLAARRTGERAKRGQLAGAYDNFGA